MANHAAKRKQLPRLRVHPGCHSPTHTDESQVIGARRILVVDAVADHNRVRRINAKFRQGISQQFRLVVARSVQFRPVFMREEGIQPKLLGNAPRIDMRFRRHQRHYMTRLMHLFQCGGNALIDFSVKQSARLIYRSIVIQRDLRVRCPEFGERVNKGRPDGPIKAVRRWRLKSDLFKRANNRSRDTDLRIGQRAVKIEKDH